MPRSALVHMARQMGCRGIWVNTSPYGYIDQSGCHRAATYNNPSSDFWFAKGSPGELRYPGYKGGAGSTGAPYKAPVDTVASNSATLSVYAHTGGVSERGNMIALHNGTTTGLSIVCGNGADSAVAGTSWGALNETVEWRWPGISFSAGWHLYTVIMGTGTNNMLFFLDDTLVGTMTLANLNGSGSVSNVYIGGMDNAANREFTGAVGVGMYWNRLLTTGEVKTLARCQRNERVLAPAGM